MPARKRTTKPSAAPRRLPAVPRQRAVAHLMDLLRIEGLSGRESEVAAAVRGKLREAGCPRSAVRHDDAHTRITRGEFEVGNLIVLLPGSPGRRREPRRLLAGHLDTVPLCRGAVPVLRRDRIVAQGDTGLGGDDRTAVAAIVSVLETIFEHGLDHPPLTVLFTVGEEVGLLGARAVEIADLGHPELGFNVDGTSPSEITLGAIGADRWEVDVRGRSAHAGVHPEDGVSATLIASRAIADVARQGFFGKVIKGKQQGTSNVGVLRGGEATNQVTDHVFLRGESRSHDPRFLDRITATWGEAFETAAAGVRNAAGVAGNVDFRAERDYEAFRLPDDAPPVVMALEAARALGLEPRLKVANGGLDANYFNARGITTVTIGAGQRAIHTVEEWVDLGDYVDACQLLLRLAVA
ncbi:MAG TPA: M20/M25/M40 family metallo-hydrolase [Thermoanaerobaculia bacterium]|nr:M20/M25/M40 family metallo-hydrolase [Thermoanaerobaculia bacterium]